MNGDFVIPWFCMFRNLYVSRGLGGGGVRPDYSESPYPDRQTCRWTSDTSIATAAMRHSEARVSAASWALARHWNGAYESSVVNIVTERWRLIRKSCSHVLRHMLIYRTRDEHKILIIRLNLKFGNAETYLLVLGSFLDRWLRTRALNSIIKNDRSNMTYQYPKI